MLQCKDFVPQLLSKKESAWVGEKFDCGTFEEAVTEAGNWLKKSGVRLIQLETVVLPNIHREGEEGSTDTSIQTGQYAKFWHQFVRVWYTTEVDFDPYR